MRFVIRACRLDALHQRRARRTRCVAVLMSLLGAVAGEQALAQPRPGVPVAPPPTDGILDCSLYRYGDDLDQAIANTLNAIRSRLASDPAIVSASRSGRAVDMTDTWRQQGFIHRVADCAQPVVSGFVDGPDVSLRVAALQAPVCQQLVASQRLRQAGLLVTVVHAPSGEPRCGGARNPVPNILSLGRLTLAGRMLPGENTVTIVAAAPRACPTLEGRPDPDVERMITEHSYTRIDFPSTSPGVVCFDSSGATSSMGICTTAQWNRHMNRLLEEFRLILARAEASKDTTHMTTRIFSAAYWLIQLSDPAKYTIESFDYVQRSCDVIRNRLVVACGIDAWNTLTQGLLDDPRTRSVDAQNGPKAFDELDEIVIDLATRLLPEPARDKLKDCFAQYNQANSLIDQLTRPLPFSDYRLLMLAEVQRAVHDAMQRTGHGDCPYYSRAVLRLDRAIWRDQYAGGMTNTLPVDWEHSFRQSAVKCLTGR